MDDNSLKTVGWLVSVHLTKTRVTWEEGTVKSVEEWPLSQWPMGICVGVVIYYWTISDLGGSILLQAMPSLVRSSWAV